MFGYIPGIENDNAHAALRNAFPGLNEESDQAWEEAVAASSIVSFSAGTQLIHCGEASQHFVIVLDGVVRVYETAESGREICLYRVYAGEICVLTLAKLLGAQNVCAEATAEEDVRLLAMPIEHFRRLMATSQGFSRDLLRAMGNSLSEIMALIGQISFQRLDLRLACLIGQLSEQKSSRKLKLTHQEVANELGTTREVVSRLLKEFEHMGCIKLSRGNIEILSSEALDRLSHFRAGATGLN